MKNFFLKTAYLLGQESKCVSKQVGCVIAKDKRIISTGINGTPPGFKNCKQHFPNYDPNLHREEHHIWSKIYEIHAEMNAIAYAAKNDIGIDGAELYTILQPCDDCLKNIIAAGIKKIYYVIPYDKATIGNELWSKIEHEQVKDDELLHWLSKEHNFQLIKSKKINTVK
jgi:dCMP deaminase